MSPSVEREIEYFNAETQNFAMLGVIDSMTTDVNYDEYSCIGSNVPRVPTQVTTRLEVELFNSIPIRLTSDAIQRFKIGTTEIHCLIKEWDMRVTNFSISLLIEAVITETIDDFSTESALVACLESQEFNEDLL